MVWNFYGDCLTDYLQLLAFAAKLCTSSGETFTVISWLTTYDYRLVLPNFAPVLVWNFYGVCLTDYLPLLAFAAKLCTSSGVKLLRWLPNWLPTTTGFCCETLHQFSCKTFTVISRLTTYHYWLLLQNFAPVLVWNFYGDCLTDYLRLLAFAAKLCNSSGVKLLRWLPYWLPTTTGFCCETLHQFWCKNVYADFLTNHVRLLAFAAKLCTSSGVKLLRWLSDWLPTTTGFCCETLHQLWRETFTVITWLTT